MSQTPRFFDTRVVSNNKVISTSMPVEVGGDADNVFRAVAVAMVNNILVQPRQNQALAQKLIELHGELFYQQPIPGQFAEIHFPKLIANPITRANFINELSLLLRMVAVKNCCEDPEQFNRVFSKEIAPQQLAESLTPIDEAQALAAISQFMKVPIMITRVEPGKELPQRDKALTRVSGAAGSLISLQKQNNQYFPLVRDPQQYQFLKTHSFKPPQLKNVSPIAYPNLAVIKAVTIPKEELLIAEYKQHVKRLNSMLEAGEITQKDLIEIYIKSVTQSGPIGTEQGTQCYFEGIRTTHEGIEPINLPFLKSKERMTQVLVDAVARGMSLKQIDSTLLDDAAEAKVGCSL